MISSSSKIIHGVVPAGPHLISGSVLLDTTVVFSGAECFRYVIPRAMTLTEFFVAPLYNRTGGSFALELLLDFGIQDLGGGPALLQVSLATVIINASFPKWRKAAFSKQLYPGRDLLNATEPYKGGDLIILATNTGFTPIFDSDLANEIRFFISHN